MLNGLPSGWMVLPLAPFIGSWLGVLIRRLPAGRPVVLGRSGCEHCGHVLGPAELLPLLSFVLQRGRCRACGARLGWFYPATELASLAVALAAFWANDGDGYVWIDAALGWTLLCAGWIDAETLRLPDSMTLPLILAGLAVSWLEQPQSIYNHAAAAALGYLAFRLLDVAYYALRQRHGLGQGDAKLLAAAGAWLGLAALPDVVVIAALLGIGFIVLSRRSGGVSGTRMIAFGPALALAFFLSRLFAVMAPS
jgi:leader peptidase (prepilin peptidase)/N-methyltransferase